MSDQTYENTDVELWRDPTHNPAGQYYNNSLSITKNGVIQIHVGGYVIGKRLEDWHKLATDAEGSLSENLRWANGEVNPQASQKRKQHESSLPIQATQEEIHKRRAEA